jgi:hypothetical protein
MTGRQLSPTPCRRDADDTTYNLIARLVLCVDELVVVPVAALGGRAWTGPGNPDVVTGDFWTLSPPPDCRGGSRQWTAP